MSTSVHIPPALLQAVDQRARTLNISRNRLIVRTLEREMAQRADWSPGFFDRVVQADASTLKAVDEMLTSVRAARRSKRPRAL